MLLNEEGLGRPAGLADGFGDAVRLGVFATETDAENAADVRMRGEREHEPDGVVVVVAAGETDDVDVGLAFADLLRDKAGALDGVDDEEVVANSLAAVFAEVALPGTVLHTRLHYRSSRVRGFQVPGCRLQVAGCGLRVAGPSAELAALAWLAWLDRRCVLIRQYPPQKTMFSCKVLILLRRA